MTTRYNQRNWPLQRELATPAVASVPHGSLQPLGPLAAAMRYKRLLPGGFPTNEHYHKG